MQSQFNADNCRFACIYGNFSVYRRSVHSKFRSNSVEKISLFLNGHLVVCKRFGHKLSLRSKHEIFGVEVFYFEVKLVNARFLLVFAKLNFGTSVFFIVIVFSV